MGVLLAAGLVCLYAAARLWRLASACLWFDEIFGVHAARHAWGDLWGFIAADLIHPPLFYALLKLWVALGGESPWWLRLFPALASIAALVPLFLLARELRLGAGATNLALLIAAANGYLIKYAQEVRMYGLMLLLTLTSLWLFARLLNSAGRARGLLLALAFVNLLLVYTHYYGWLVVACEAVFVVLKERRRVGAFLLASGGLALAYVPWVAACVRASARGGGLAQNIGWIERPGASDLVQLFALFNQPFYFRQSSADPLYARGGALFGLLLVGLPVLALLLRAARKGRSGGAGAQGTGTGPVGEVTAEAGSAGASVEDEGRGARRPPPSALGRAEGAVAFLLLFTLLPVALAFAASYALPQSVWGARHLVVAFTPYALLAGLALERLRPHWWRGAALTLLCCWLGATAALTLVRRDAPQVWCAWEGLASSAARDEARGPAVTVGGAAVGGGASRTTDVYAFEDLVAYHLWFALERGETAGRFRVVSIKGAPGVAEDPAYFLPRAFDGVAVATTDALRGDHFWLAFRDTAWDESRQPLKLITERGYRAERVYETAAQGQRAFLVLFTRAVD
ncbi:MAG TPA: glycosyltransferase family 39 protein [Pyrinomonadaceae bacterium]